MRYKVITVIGARPQFIKTVPLSKVFQESDSIDHFLLHTGQHYDKNMSDIFFQELGIAEPKWNLDISGSNHGEMTGKMIIEIERVLMSEKPDMVVVLGDTNSTLAGSIAAVKLNIPVAHIEAGLRSFRSTQPEEINRILTDRVSKILFCPTKLAVNNLLQEGIKEKVYHVGDVMYDTALLAVKISNAKSNIMNILGLKTKSYNLLTIHRQENTNDPIRLKAIVDYVMESSKRNPIIMPLHPRTKTYFEKYEIDTSKINLIEPLGYLDITQLLRNAEILFTDSGGMQKEAYFQRTLCVTLRDETEWQETIESGWNRLWTQKKWNKKSEILEYGQGNSAEQILKIITDYLMLTKSFREYIPT